MTSPHDSPAPRAAALTPMRGRDPHQTHRAATPLELLFDLTFVIGFGSASSEFAHAVAAGHLASGLAAFAVTMFGVCWAWVNFSWFSSAYDTDDWGFRLATMVQMVGVVVLSLGVPRVFASMENGAFFDNGVMVLGYVIMRLAMVALWARAARDDAGHRRSCATYAVLILIAQVGWVALALARPGWTTVYVAGGALAAFELLAPVAAEKWAGEGGTPWHAHHMAERYGLLAIIALGEEVVGTVASVSAIVQHQGWSLEAVAICAAGVALTFGMWWLYFLVPAAPVLHRFRARAFPWAYLHIPLFAAIAATGAGLHVAGLYIEHKASIGPLGVVASVAAPVCAFILLLAAIYLALFRKGGRLHVSALVVAGAVVGLSVGLAAAGANLALCLALLALAPGATVAGHEFGGNADIKAALASELDAA